MQHDGSNKLAGPVRGTPGWWQRLGQQNPSPTKARKRAPKKRSSERGIRTELVARVRREIAAGTYDTPEKWDAALDALLDHLEQA